MQRLATQHSIDSHQIHDLEWAISMERKKRKRGKRLNLLGESDSGPQFFSPSKVVAAREYQAEKEAKEEREKQEKINRKVQAAIKRKQVEMEKKERALQREMARQMAQEKKAQALL